MKTQQLKVVAQLANEVLRLAQMVLVEQGISKNSNLYKDLKVKIDTSNDSIVINTFFNNYITFIENGRAPKTGKKPPIDALRTWAQSNGLPTDNNTLHAISYAIWRDGVEARPILATLEQRIGEYIDNEFCDKLIDEITIEINKYFE